MYKNQATKVFLSKCDELSPIQNLQEVLNMSPGMACIIRISEIMLLSAFKSPRIYPSSVCNKIVSACAQHAHAIIFENYSKILNLNLNFDYKKSKF